jgi:hypothetical protein
MHVSFLVVIQVEDLLIVGECYPILRCFPSAEKLAITIEPFVLHIQKNKP